jgi:DNA modification methylase
VQRLTSPEALVLASLDSLAAMAGSDDEKLRALLADVSVDSEALAAMLSGIAPSATKAGRTDPDEIPAPPDAATTEPGDLWLLGDHRLLCGDAGSVEDLDRLLDGAPVSLLATDPPYNVRVEPRSNNAIAAGLSSFRPSTTHHQALDLARHPEKAQATHRKLRAKDRPLTNDFVTDAEFSALLAAWFGNASRVLRPGCGFYVWGGYANVANYPPALREAGLYFSQAIIWVKEHPVLTRKDFMGNHEWAFYGWKEGAAHRFFGPPNVPDVWSVKKVNPASMVHLTRSRWS